MIPFEEERSLTASEKYAQSVLQSNWSHVVWATSGVREDLEGRFPELSEKVSENIKQDTGSGQTVFRPGVPDFLAFNDTGEYVFVEVKSGEDGIRASQLKWLRDFSGINAEIWFTKGEKVEEKLDTENISAYTFQDRKGETSENKVVEENGPNYLVELPKTLASILGLEKEDSIEWRLKSKDELILDSK
ncbi:MAG: VRR-NUC domain-containing protein [Candidatus Nanohalobium sp.]